MSEDRLLDDWIQAYLTFTAESEAPDEFHTWVAISTIAGVLRRRVYFDMGYFQLFPNLYIVLVSPAGRCKKSTTMRIARPMLAEVPGINFSVDSTTRERLIQDLTQTHKDGHSSMTAYSSEFASLLTSSGMDMVVFLTDLYDCPNEWTHKTKSGGTNKILNPYLNLMAATTPDWIGKAMPLDTIGIGLTSRIIFVYSDTPRVRPPFPKLSKAQHELGSVLKRDLKQMSLISGKYTLNDDTEEAYTMWFNQRQEEVKHVDSRLAGYFARKDMHLLKTMMLVCASRRQETAITLDDLDTAFDLLKRVESTMPRVFSGVGKSPIAFDLEQTLVTVLSNPDGIAFSTLLDMFKHSIRKEELSEVLETLSLTNHIKMVQTKDGPKYYPKKGEANGI